MRSCNKCKVAVTQDWLGFEGEFPDWNYELDLCDNCASEFKFLVDTFCGTNIDTNTELSEGEKAEREPVSRLNKKLKGLAEQEPTRGKIIKVKEKELSS